MHPKKDRPIPEPPTRTVPRTNIPKGKPWIVGVDEISSLTSHLSMIKPTGLISADVIEEKQKLHELSRARVKTWANTVTGQRQQKLQELQRKREMEEEERKKVDQLFAQEEAERRQKAVEHAKRLVYYQNDKVRAVHSEVLLDLVMQERERQLRYKQEKKQVLDQIQKQWHNVMDQELEKKNAFVAQQQRNSKRRALEIAETQKRQQQATETKKQNKERRRIVVRHQIMESDRDYILSKAEEERNHRRKQKQLHEEMMMLNCEGKHMHQEEEQRQRLREEVAKKWSAAKQNQVEKQHSTEKKILMDGIQKREALGYSQMESARSQRHKRDEWIYHWAQQPKFQDHDYEPEKRLRKEQYARELRQQCEKIQQNQLLVEKDQQEKNKIIIHDNEALCVLLEEEKLAEKEHIRRSNLEIQKTYKVQVERKRALKQKEKEQQMVEIKERTDRENSELTFLQDYVQSLLGEPWMLENKKKKDVAYYVGKSFEKSQGKI